MILSKHETSKTGGLESRSLQVAVQEFPLLCDLIRKPQPKTQPIIYHPSNLPKNLSGCFIGREKWVATGSQPRTNLAIWNHWPVFRSHRGSPPPSQSAQCHPARGARATSLPGSRAHLDPRWCGQVGCLVEVKFWGKNVNCSMLSTLGMMSIISFLRWYLSGKENWESQRDNINCWHELHPFEFKCPRNQAFKKQLPKTRVLSKKSVQKR